VYWAALRSGLYLTAVNHHLQQAEISYILNDCGAKALIVSAGKAEQALAAVEQGTVRGVVLLGADPIGTWPGGDRWRGLMERAFFALQVTPFQNGSTGWATTIVPAAMAVEKEGTATNLDGPHQPRRPAAPPRHRPPAQAADRRRRRLLADVLRVRGRVLHLRSEGDR